MSGKEKIVPMLLAGLLLVAGMVAMMQTAQEAEAASGTDIYIESIQLGNTSFPNMNEVALTPMSYTAYTASGTPTTTTHISNTWDTLMWAVGDNTTGDIDIGQVVFAGEDVASYTIDQINFTTAAPADDDLGGHTVGNTSWMAIDPIGNGTYILVVTAIFSGGSVNARFPLIVCDYMVDLELQDDATSIDYGLVDFDDSAFHMAAAYPDAHLREVPQNHVEPAGIHTGASMFEFWQTFVFPGQGFRTNLHNNATDVHFYIPAFEGVSHQAFSLPGRFFGLDDENYFLPRVQLANASESLSPSSHVHEADITRYENLNGTVHIDLQNGMSEFESSVTVDYGTQSPTMGFYADLVLQTYMDHDGDDWYDDYTELGNMSETGKQAAISGYLTPAMLDTFLDASPWRGRDTTGVISMDGTNVYDVTEGYNLVFAEDDDGNITTSYQMDGSSDDVIDKPVGAIYRWRQQMAGDHGIDTTMVLTWPDRYNLQDVQTVTGDLPEPDIGSLTWELDGTHSGITQVELYVEDDPEPDVIIDPEPEPDPEPVVATTTLLIILAVVAVMAYFLFGRRRRR